MSQKTTENGGKSNWGRRVALGALGAIGLALITGFCTPIGGQLEEGAAGLLGLNASPTPTVSPSPTTPLPTPAELYDPSRPIQLAVGLDRAYLGGELTVQILSITGPSFDRIATVMYSTKDHTCQKDTLPRLPSTDGTIFVLHNNNFDYRVFVKALMTGSAAVQTARVPPFPNPSTSCSNAYSGSDINAASPPG